MLVRLSIRDIVLIDKLDLDFAPGLAVLTGETGAGKSILLDAFALALGARGDAGLVRQGAEQGQVTAVFDVPARHPARALLNEHGIDAEDDLILRRIQSRDGKTRAFINDQPVSVQVLRSLGAALVEIHGQHDDRALVDAATHRALLDAYAGAEDKAADVARLWEECHAAARAVETHRIEVERAQREADYLRHAVDELAKLRPEAGEETVLAERRSAMMQARRLPATCAMPMTRWRATHLRFPVLLPRSEGLSGAARRRPAWLKVASGGELARFMLALKVVLASRGSAPTLIFDEIDSGVGGAVADAVGQRLARLAGACRCWPSPIRRRSRPGPTGIS
jgi:DNA repair ATPase RecN